MTKSSTITLPTFTIGPRSIMGRGYEILSCSGSLNGLGSFYVDLPMVLLEWGKQQKQLQGPDKKSFILCLPTNGGGQMLMRGRYIEEGTQGPIAAINGVILDESALKALDYRPERILNDLPEPQNVSDSFGKQDWVGKIASAPSTGKRDLLSLGKYNWIIKNDSAVSNESLLMEWLGRIPDNERQAVQGFTTNALCARGSINPLRKSNLAIVNEAQSLPTHLYAVLNESGEIIQKHGPNYENDHKLGNVPRQLLEAAAAEAEQLRAEAAARAEKAAEQAKARAEKRAEQARSRAEKKAELAKTTRYTTPAGPKKEPRGLLPENFKFSGNRFFFPSSHLLVTAPEEHVDIIRHAFPEATVEHTHGSTFTLKVPRPKDGSHVERLKSSIDKAVCDPVSGGKGFSR